MTDPSQYEREIEAIRKSLKENHGELLNLLKHLPTPPEPEVVPIPYGSVMPRQPEAINHTKLTLSLPQ